MWPPSFPDLNPMNFCMWSFLDKKITQEHYRAAVDEFQRRYDMVIDVKGGHIE